VAPVDIVGTIATPDHSSSAILRTGPMMSGDSGGCAQCAEKTAKAANQQSSCHYAHA